MEFSQVMAALFQHTQKIVKLFFILNTTFFITVMVMSRIQNDFIVQKRKHL